MKIKGKVFAIWGIVASMLFLSSALPTAYGLEFPMSSAVEIEVDPTLLAASVNPIDSAAALYGSIDLAATPLGAIFSSDMALVSAISASVEMARTQIGAKKVAQVILTQEYGFDDSQFSCLNSLWTKESHWNYKAHNYRSGAHGIAQALPAEKMSVIATDWRTNPVTQIRWGIRYITMRYDTPCKAWSKWKSHRYY
ncbi:MAG: transglycosylase SLT domain-containing protein [Actinomycetales bacterium]|nr:transglycosylase SLT domain-containing protein [Actinomycetales bacterium]